VLGVPSVGRNGSNKVRDVRISEEDMTSADQMQGMAGACSGIMDVSHVQCVCLARKRLAGQIAYRHNATRVSMMPFSSEEIHSESMCYHHRALHRKLGPYSRHRPRATLYLSSGWILPAELWSKNLGFLPNVTYSGGCFLLRSNAAGELAPPSATPVTCNGKLRSLLLSHGAKTVVFAPERSRGAPSHA